MIAKLRELGPSSIAFQVQLTLTFRRLKLMQDLNGVSLLCIEFQRLTNSMRTSEKMVTEKSMLVWGESLTVTITLYKDSRGKYLEEEGTIVLLGFTKGKTWEPMGSVVLKLNLLAPELPTEKVALRLANDKGEAICIIKTAVTAKLLSQREYNAADALPNEGNGWSPMSIFNNILSSRPNQPQYSPTSTTSADNTTSNGNMSMKDDRRISMASTSSDQLDPIHHASDKETIGGQGQNRSESPELFEFIDDEYLLYDGTSRLYLGPGSPSKLSKNGGIGREVDNNNGFFSQSEQATEANLAELTRDLEESRKSVARLEKEYLRLQSINDDGMIDQMVRAEIDVLTAAEKETTQLVLELDIAQSQVLTAVLSIELQEVQAELVRAKEKIAMMQREKDMNAKLASALEDAVDATNKQAALAAAGVDGGISQESLNTPPLNASQEQLSKALSKIRDAKREKERLEADLSRAKQEIMTARQETMAMEKQLTKQRKETAALSNSHISSMEESVVLYSKSLQTSENEAHRCRQVIAELEAKMTMYEQENEQLQKQVMTLTAVVKDAEVKRNETLSLKQPTPPAIEDPSLSSSMASMMLRPLPPRMTKRTTGGDSSPVGSTTLSKSVKESSLLQTPPTRPKSVPSKWVDPSAKSKTAFMDCIVELQTKKSPGDSPVKEHAAMKAEYEEKIANLEGVLDSFVRKLKEARDAEDEAKAHAQRLETQVTALRTSNNNNNNNGVAARDGNEITLKNSISPGSKMTNSSVSKVESKVGTRINPTRLDEEEDDDDALTMEDDIRIRLDKAESSVRQYQERCVEYDCVIESFVRKLKAARDSEIAAITKLEEIQQRQQETTAGTGSGNQEESSKSVPRKIAPKTTSSNTGFVSIWR